MTKRRAVTTQYDRGLTRLGTFMAPAILVALAVWAPPAFSATFGVPDHLLADGRACIAPGNPAGCTYASTNPPGYFILNTTGSGAAAGDSVHQIRFFIEATGTTLDIRVFDADSNNDYDYNGTVSTEYRLYSPAGAQIQLNTIAGASAATNNRLARFNCNGGWENPNAGPNYFGLAGCANGATIAPGRYEFRVTVNDAGTNQYNAFGIDIRDGSGNPYNVYIESDATNPDSSMVIGAFDATSGTGLANITPPMVFYSYVNRGCTIQTSNFDMDSTGPDAATPVQIGSGAYATLTDAVGASAPSLTMSGATVHSEDTITVAPTDVTNLDVGNYGMYALVNGPGSQQNIVDWRVADWQGWNDDPANAPRDPTNPIRTYLPNAPCPVGTCGAATDPPSEPVLTTSARVCAGGGCTTPGGANPPVVGQNTGFQILATLYNPGPAAITNVRVYGGATSARVTYRGNPRCYLDGVELTAGCTFTQPAVGTAGPFSVDVQYLSALATGQWFGLTYEIQLNASGFDDLIGAPGEVNAVRATYTAFGTGTALTENLGPMCQIPINIGDVSVTKAVAPASVQPGGFLTYTIAVSSAGNAGSAYWTDTLPAGTIFQSLNNPAPSTWTCSTPSLGGTGTVSCSAATLANGASATFTLVVQVSPAYPAGPLGNTATVASEGDTNLANNSATATATVTAPPTLTVAKSASVSSQVVGSNFTYTVVVTNSGTSGATGVVITDSLPAARVAYVSAPGCVWASPTLTCNIGALGAGASATRTITVAAASAGTAVNTATVSSATPGGTSQSLPVTTQIYAAAPASPTCAVPGRDGDLTVTGVMTVNTHYPGNATASAGATSITLGAARGATPIAAGDLLLVIQMQDANFNRSNTNNYGAGNGTGRGSTVLNNAGRYEFVRATNAVGLGGGVVNIVGTGAGNGLLYAYANADADLAGGTQQGQRRFQVIRVPQYNSVGYGSGTTFGTLTALQWNGRTGGVLALDVAGTMTLGADPVLSVQSLTRAAYSNANAVTVTVTTSVAHNYSVGDLVTIAGADQAPYNGTFPISSVTATTFTYTIVSTWVDQRAGTAEYPATPATGAITAARYPVDVTGRGFRGGGGRANSGGGGAYTDYRTTYANGPNGSKGEGIDGTPQLVFDPLNGAWDPRRVTNTGVDGYPSGSMARGAPGTAGGGGTDGNPSANDENSGGGGGGNGGIGGQGGNSWNSNYASGGIGGDSFSAAADLIVMGGGGGAGSRNNSALSEASGGAGGGIVMIRAGAVAGAGAVIADGAQGVATENDGGGGGGAGGAIVIAAASGGLGGVTARARGARGTDAWASRTQPVTNFPDERHGPGGGGGGGWVFTTSTPGSIDVTGGAPGVTTLANDTYGASPGAPGQSATISLSQIPGVDSGPECSADLAIVKTAAVVSSTSLVYTLVVTNNGFWSAAAATVTDVLPLGTTYVSAIPTIGTCSYAAFTRTVTCNLGTMVVGATATITIRVIPPASGTLTNTGTVASTTPDPVSTNNSSTVVTTLVPPTDLGVTITAPADPLTAGSTATYLITVVNNGPNAAPNATLTIPIPENAAFQSITPPSGWTCVTPPVGSGPPAEVVCSLASAPVDLVGVVFSLVLGIPAGTPAGTVITLTAVASTSGLDTNAPNDSAAASNTVGPPIELLTRATIVGLRVSPQAGLVEFATGMQHGTVSFNVYATNDPEGEEGLVLLNDSPILSPRPNSTTPILYALHTDPITAHYVVVEERDTKGRSQWAGPFSVASRHMRLAYERIKARFDLQNDAMLAWGGDRSVSRSFSLRRAAAERRAWRGKIHARPWRRGPRIAQHGIRIETSGAGLISVLRSDLEAAGLPVGAPLSRMRLSSQGRPVSFEVVGSGADEALRFIAEPLSTLYSGRNAYVVTWGHGQPRMQVPLTNPETQTEPGFARVRKNTLYLSTTPLDHDPWFWDALLSDGTIWPSQEWLEWFPGINEFDLAGLLPGSGDAPVKVALWTDVAGRHDVTVWINGVYVGDVSFDGPGDLVLQGRIAVSALSSEKNVLQIGYAGTPESPDALAYVCLRHVDIGAPMDPAARVAVAQPPDGYDASLPDLQSAEYLIVTHPEFASQAERIAQLKRAEGLRVAVVDVERAYDFFSGGIVEARAIHEVIRTAARGRSLRFVLLIGADTYDPRDFVATGAVSYVPSLYGWDGEYGRVPSENRYADVDGDGKPDLAIGRLPVQTAAEADVLAGKISRQQAALKAAARRHVFVVDNGPSFRAEASAVAAAFPAATELWSDLTNGWTAARQALWDAWSQGVALTHYFGHGGPEQWADERLADVEDAQSVKGSGSVFLTWTCMTQDYQYLWGPSINEAFLLNPNGGALASFGPAGIAELSAQAALYARIYDELKTPGVTLGEAIRRGKARAVSDDALSIPAVDGFNLLGDPSLRLPSLGGPEQTAQGRTRR